MCKREDTFKMCFHSILDSWINIFFVKYYFDRKSNEILLMAKLLIIISFVNSILLMVKLLIVIIN